MDENSELLLLASHTIKKDLEHKNHFIIGAALNAISEVCSESMCLDCTPIIIKCLSHNNPYIRKKASLALCKVLMKCPDLIESIAEHLDKVINDTDHGVLLCGLTLAIKAGLGFNFSSFFFAFDYNVHIISLTGFAFCFFSKYGHAGGSCADACDQDHGQKPFTVFHIFISVL